MTAPLSVSPPVSALLAGCEVGANPIIWSNDDFPELAGDRLAENMTPLGRAYYAASTLNCVPTSLSQPRGMALGAQAGESRLREIVCGAGFKGFRRAVDAPFNLVIEATP